MAIDTTPVVTGMGFSQVRQALNNNFTEIKNEFDNVRKESKTGIIFGTYTGNGEASQDIATLGGQPIAVEVYAIDGAQVISPSGISQYYGGFAIQGKPCKNGGLSVIEITDFGFKVFYDRSRYIFANSNNAVYYYKAYINGTIKN